MRARVLALVAAALAAGCTVGPDFRAPDPPAVDRYTPGPPPAAPGMPKLVRDRDIPAQWWEVFGSAELDALVRRALAQGPTLDQARARLAQAQELRTARHGAVTYPQFDATFGAERQRIDPATFGFPQAPNPGPFNVFSLGGGVAYQFDLFGGARRDLEALAAEVDYRAYELEAARLTLAANVVDTAIRQASLAAQADLVAGVAAAQRRQLAIVERRYADGAVAWLDVQRERAQVARTEALLPSLRAQGAQAGHVLAVLMGEPPGVATGPEVRLADLRLPAELPLPLPAELVRQRPDIRASEALLHKASANVGVATADLYPKLVVTGSFSSGQLELSHVLGSGINIWNVGLNLLQPVFRHDELSARRRAAVAAWEEAAAGYRVAVLHGLQEVADVLRALEADALTLAARSEQAARADDAFRIALARYDAGGASQLAVLDAERTRLEAEIDRVRAQAARYASAAALFQALGGGWTTAGSAPSP